MDKRRAPRIRSLLQARVVYNNGLASLDCVIRNQSPGGMRLSISQAVLLPDEFDLHIPKKNEVHRVRLTWRRAEEIGVAIVREAGRRAPSVGDLHLAGLAELDAEIERLERLLLALRARRDATATPLQEQSTQAYEVDRPLTQDPAASLPGTVEVLDERTFEWLPAGLTPKGLGRQG